MEIRALQKGDDRTAFSCDDHALDRFFRDFAGQNQFKHHLGVTYVSVDEGKIFGFATLAPGHLDFDGLPAGLQKKFPRYPVPILRVARLAVARDEQKKGHGTQLLRFALKLALKMSAEIGCAGVVADAKLSAVAFYAQYGFEPLEAIEGLSQARPAPFPMLLTIHAIQDAEQRNAQP